MFNKRNPGRKLFVESLEDRRMLAGSVPDGISLDDGTLYIDGTLFDDTASVELVFNPAGPGGLAGSGVHPADPDIGGAATSSTWTVKAKLIYDPGPSIYDDPFANSTVVVVIFEADLADVTNIDFVGGSGSDTFTNDTHLSSTANGGDAADYMFGGSGSDYFFGGDGCDELFGREGHDILRGNLGNDDLYGGAGDDDLYGGDSYDDLFGGDGADRLFGGDGPDRLNGGNVGDAHDGAIDELEGGDDADFFTPEIHYVVLDDGFSYIINYDLISDYMHGADTIVGYSGDLAEALGNGEPVQLTLNHLGPQHKTTYNPFQVLDLPGLSLTPIGELSGDVWSSAQVTERTQASSPTQTSQTANLDLLFADLQTDWAQLAMEPVIKKLAAER